MDLQEGTGLNNMAKNLLLWLVIAAVLLSVFNNFSMQGATPQLGYSDFIEEVNTNYEKVHKDFEVSRASCHNKIRPRRRRRRRQRHAASGRARSA